MARNWLLVGTLALCFTACTSDTDQTQPTAAEQAETETTTTAAPTSTTSEATTASEPTTTTTEAAEGTTEEAGPACGIAVTVSFGESAPRDRMTIVNDASASVTLSLIEIDLSNSAGGVIFDTLDGGAGVEVFQDFQVESGEAALTSEPVVDDGANQLSLSFDSFEPGESFVFSIDVDDQLTDSDLGQIQVSGAELAGAEVVITTAEGEEATAVFDTASTAEFISDC